jgi:exodeoxyribonuclease V beta subunit
MAGLRAAPAPGRRMDGRGRRLHHPRLVQSHAARARLRQRQPVHARRWKPTRTNCRTKPCATTGAPSSIRCRRDARVREWWPIAPELRQAVRKLLEHRDAGAGAPPCGEALRTRANTARASWRAEGAVGEMGATKVQALLDAAVAQARSMARKLRTLLPALAAAAARLGAGAATCRWLKSTAWTRLTPRAWREVWKAEGARRTTSRWRRWPPCASACVPADCRTDILCHATHWIAAALGRGAGAPRRDGLRRPADAAGRVRCSGPNGPRLAALIREQFPVALIDEFQDTDPVQYRIFDAVYGVARNAQDTALVLIGDPKQAIYAFRGADIHTYLAARRDTATGTPRWAPTSARPGMVEAVNRVPAGRGAGPGRGRLPVPRAPRDNPLPFVPVRRAGATSSGSSRRGRAGAHLLVARRGKAMTNYHVRGMAPPAPPRSCGCCNWGSKAAPASQGRGQVLRAVRPGDIAVLVNTGREAARCARRCRSAACAASTCPTRTRVRSAGGRRTCSACCRPAPRRTTAAGARRARHRAAGPDWTPNSIA